MYHRNYLRMRNKLKMASDHVAEEDSLEGVTTDCFTNECNVVSTEEDDNSEIDDDVTTIDDGSASATSTSDVTEYLPLEKAKSVAWNHFGFPSRSGKFIQKDKRLRKEVFCKLCKHPLFYKGNTTHQYDCTPSELSLSRV